MARIALAELSQPFDGRTMAQKPLGGTETAVVLLAEALAARGHGVRAVTRIERPTSHQGVDWIPVPRKPLEGVDLFIASRSPDHLRFAPDHASRVLWVHNPARYLRRLKNLPAIWRHRPHVVLLGAFHESTLSSWLPFASRRIIAHAPEPEFRTTPEIRPAPPPRAIFCSNPLRSLGWLLQVWERRIRPRVPAAELHLYTGPKTYGGTWSKKMAPVLELARRLRDQGVFLHEPVPKKELARVMRRSRAMLYRGDPGETFCLAAAEARETGVPLVTQGVGALRERFIDGKDGILAPTEKEFADAAIRVLSDDAHWLRLHAGAMEVSGSRTWDDVAADFESYLLPA